MFSGALILSILFLSVNNSILQKTCNYIVNNMSKITINNNIELNEVNNGALTGKSIQANELWQDKPAIVLVTRRPG